MQSSSAKKVLDARLGQALQSGSPADISAAYKELADFHFEMRNMAAADELYAFSALHSRGSSNAISISEYGNADADERYGSVGIGVSVGEVVVTVRQSCMACPCESFKAPHWGEHARVWDGSANMYNVFSIHRICSIRYNMFYIERA